MSKQFNELEWTKLLVLKAYFKALLTGKKTEKLTVEMKGYSTAVFSYLEKNKALEVKSISKRCIEENGTKKYVYEVKIENINTKAEFTSKNGEIRNLFFPQTIGTGYRLATKELEEEYATC